MNYSSQPYSIGLTLGSTLPYGQMVLVKSQILDVDTQKPIENATIQIESDTSVGVITNSKGVFEIYARPKDNLIIRHLTHETLKLPVSGIHQTEFLVPRMEQIEAVDLGVVKKKKDNTVLYFGLGLLLAFAIPHSKKKSDEKENSK